MSPEAYLLVVALLALLIAREVRACGLSAECARLQRLCDDYWDQLQAANEHVAEQAEMIRETMAQSKRMAVVAIGQDWRE